MSSSSLHRDGVDAEELGRMGLASVLLADVGLERTVGRPLELPQLMGKGRAILLGIVAEIKFFLRITKINLWRD